jgi:serine/threonine-protein kinase RsbW
MTASTVTSHPFSQKLAAAGGFHECGLMVGYAPKPTFKGMQTKDQPRECTLQWAQDFVGGWSAEICPPPRHRDMIATLFERLGWRIAVREPGEGSGPADFHWKALPAMRSLHLEVGRTGAGLWDKIPPLLHDFDRQGYQYSTISLPLGDPGVPALTEVLESAGFFFAGLEIGTGQGDPRLCLQRLFGVTMDLDLLALETENGRALRDYIRQTAPVLAVG